MSCLILASGSPRRVELLGQLGLPFEQRISPEDEPSPFGAPREHAVHSARAKADAVRRHLPSQRADEAFIIGADTIVCIDDILLGKPVAADDARQMLQRLSGRQHSVCTGLAIVGPDGTWQTATEVTHVEMKKLSSEEIDWYVGSGEPLDKAGSYAIQGLGARFVERIEGCYYNVVGLPLYRLATLLAAAGYPIDTQVSSTPSSGGS